ncbi:uncharacterized protein UV8b_06553 [Ustilaginoidea virens]|uniref:Uncharacterized protein n=1 Tax=Ustilaginoidea virens TaxID=1159556 RepID=A0A063C8T2_USTVR|nr:uncharacterized protein UV8b_06553 [Ustilaginoidea virens]QUC22312.1 hypothetical protein UV8b_06553 [Ustilaginoidea virens]GAO14149.1 hypothetical protein UVI_02037660 [Ustilaginoidea virens]
MKGFEPWTNNGKWGHLVYDGLKLDSGCRRQRGGFGALRAVKDDSRTARNRSDVCQLAVSVQVGEGKPEADVTGKPQ